MAAGAIGQPTPPQNPAYCELEVDYGTLDIYSS